MLSKLVFSTALGVALTLVSGRAWAGCKEGFCVHGQDSQHTHSVSFSHNGFPARTYNVRAGGNEFTLRRHREFFEFEIGAARPVTFSFEIQACGFDGSCGPWVSFSHTAREPSCPAGMSFDWQAGPNGSCRINVK